METNSWVSSVERKDVVFRDNGDVINIHVQLINVHCMLEMLPTLRNTFLTLLKEIYFQALELLFQKEVKSKPWSPVEIFLRMMFKPNIQDIQFFLNEHLFLVTHPSTVLNQCLS